MPAGLANLIPLVLLIVVMYFLMIRPQKKKDKQIQDMRKALTVGDEIVTIGGICGKIVKTKEDSSDWTIAEMSKREKKKSGSYKKSFLGFIFYNYLAFGAECSHCHFVSNNDFDKEVLLWQSYIEDGKRLQTENIVLYEKIKDRIKNEF